MERNINVLPIKSLGLVQDHEGALLVSFLAPDGAEFGFLLPDATAAELSGALIERSRQNHQAHGAPGSSVDDADFHVSSVEALAPEDDKCVLRLASEGGPVLTFRLGARMVRRWRDMLTDYIVRHERRHQQ